MRKLKDRTAKVNARAEFELLSVKNIDGSRRLLKIEIPKSNRADVSNTKKYADGRQRNGAFGNKKYTLLNKGAACRKEK